MVEPVKSDQPTVLIAPSDYEHIYKAEIVDKKTVQTKNKNKIAKIPSDQPTVLIAPSDYEHIFKGALKNETKYPEVEKIASDTPTALIAPSDFQHIYWDPKLKKTEKQKTTVKNMAQVLNESTKMKLSTQRSINQHEELPRFILDLVEKFISKQKKVYTIKKQ